MAVASRCTERFCLAASISRSSAKQARRLIFPEMLEPIGRQSSIANRGHDRAVPEIGLDGASVVAVVGELEPAGVPQHVGMNEEFEFRSHSRPGHHALTSCELNGGLWRGLCTKFEAGFSRGHLPARSEWNPFAALKRYAGCRVKTGSVWRKLEMTCMIRTPR